MNKTIIAIGMVMTAISLISACSASQEVVTQKANAYNTDSLLRVQRESHYKREGQPTDYD